MAFAESDSAGTSKEIASPIVNGQLRHVRSAATHFCYVKGASPNIPRLHEYSVEVRKEQARFVKVLSTNQIVPCTVMRRTMKAVKSTVALAAALSPVYSSID